jgi:hypothetical protein
MKLTTLGCDWCRGARPAVASPTLVVGPAPRKGDPTLDLCGPHLAQLQRYFRPIKRTKRLLIQGRGKRPRNEESIEAKREKERARYHTRQAAARANAEPKPKRSRHWREKGLEALARKRAKWAQAREEREQAVLAVLRKADHRLARPELDQATGLSVTKVKQTLQRLIVRKEVTCYGVGPHARYELASKARHGSSSDAA